MKDFIEEFKGFALKGNVVDLAVAVVIGAAFGKIVSSLVDNIIMPIVGILLGGVNFSGLRLEIGKALINYGTFIQSVFDFIIVALVIFIFIKALAKLKREEAVAPTVVIEPSDEIKLLTEIRDSLRHNYK